MTRSIHKDDYLQVLWDVAIDLHGIFSPLLGSHHVKLIEDPHGNFVVARDGYSVAHELAYRARNPITQAILKAGDVQGQVFGTLVEETIVLACNLVLSGRDLLDQGLHPYNITKGFHAAQQHARSWLQARLQRVGPSVTDVHRVLGEFLAQRLSEDVSRHLSRLITPFLQSRVQKLVDGDNSHALATMGCVFARIVDDMNILIKPGGRILDSFLVDGCAISKEPVGWRTCIDRAVLGSMPGGRVALVSGEEYFTKEMMSRFEARFTGHDAMRAFINGTNDSWVSKAKQLYDLDVAILITERGIDDNIVSQFVKYVPTALVFRRIPRKEIDTIARHTGATVVHSIDHLSSDCLGRFDRIWFDRINNENIFFLADSSKHECKTLVLSGSMHDICESAKKHLLDAIKSVVSTFQGTLVGFPWVLRDLPGNDVPPGTVAGKACLAFETFMGAIDAVAKQYAINAGFDPLECTRDRLASRTVSFASLSSAIELATETASSLTRVDGLVISHEGWKKRGQLRGGDKNETNKERTIPSA